MAMKFYNVEKAAEILGRTPAEINQMREQQQLHGYRDGADWKFKAEDIDAMAAETPPETAPGEEATEDIILSEVELGESDPSTSGTVIGPPPAEALGSSLSGFDDLDLTLAESGVDMSGLDIPLESAVGGTSELDLTTDGLDDDDLVLGASDVGSGSGSDITIGGDSGISLLDPTDSGLSLEEPLDLTSGSQESLALGEDEVLAMESGTDTESPTELGDSDFMLTPMDELGEDESSSQVIALDEESSSGDLVDAAPMLDDGGLAEPFAEEMPSDVAAPLGETMPMEAAPAVAPGGMPMDYSAMQPQAAGPAAPALPEAPYSVLNIVGLAFCTVVLLLIGMMMYDLMRNMWSWNQPLSFDSWLMDLILGRG
jgi:hypothetical protein